MKPYQVIFLATAMASCLLTDDKNCQKAISPSNSSNDTLYVYWSLVYPDTSLSKLFPTNPIAVDEFTFLPSEVKQIAKLAGDRVLCWQDVFKSEIPSDTLSIYIFNRKNIVKIGPQQ
jgi:hypothetical protein